ncbi:MAG: S8 family serine peptidase [Actinomycetota bacterium]
MPHSSRWLVAVLLVLLAAGAAPAQGRTDVNDPVFAQALQWNLDLIGAPDAWDRGTGRGVTIAVVDSGADLGHQDLSGKISAQVSCIGANGDPGDCGGSAQDDNGHGTHVAGIAGAATNNGIGVAGVAPDARLQVVRVLANDCGPDGCTASGTSNDVSAGIRWAVDHGADIINLSLGGGTVQSALGCSFCDAIDYAWSKGVIAVVAAGNDSMLPAGFGDEPAIIVTATTRDDERASYSSASSSLIREARWPVAAPGGESETQPSDCATGGTPKGVLSTYWIQGSSNQYACLAGTSMATPHVSGGLAILLSLGHSPQSAVDRLLATAKDLGPAGRDDTFGFGRIDLAKAVGAASATTTTTGQGGTTAPTSGPGSTRPGSGATTLPGSSSSEVPTTVDQGRAPVISTPETSAAAPFSPDDGRGDGPPSWLVVTAVVALLTSGSGTVATARRLLR